MMAAPQPLSEAEEAELRRLEAQLSGSVAHTLCNSIDARVWTAEWLKCIRAEPVIPTDEGTMLGWFANAIMAGFDEAKRRDAATIANLRAVVSAANRVIAVYDKWSMNPAPKAWEIADVVTDLRAALAKVKGDPVVAQTEAKHG